MTTQIKHARTADALSRATSQVENLREGIADAVRNDLEGGARDRIVCELANLSHEIEQAFRAMR